jgi:hypothetical protein
LVPKSRRSIDENIAVDKHDNHNDNIDDNDNDTINAGDTDDDDTDDDDGTNDSEDADDINDTADSDDKHNDSDVTYTAGTDNGTAANKFILAPRESINTSSIHCGIHQPHYVDRPDVGVSRQYRHDPRRSRSGVVD